MSKLFQAAAFDAFGSTVAIMPVRIEKKLKTNLAYFYYFSLSKMARALKNTGQIRCVRHEDGRDVYFTDKNYHGRQPTKDSKLVLAGFGVEPDETAMTVDRAAYAAYRQRQKMPRPAGIVIEASRQSPAGPRKVAATTRSAARGGPLSAGTVRPAQQTKPAASRKNLG